MQVRAVECVRDDDAMLGFSLFVLGTTSVTVSESGMCYCAFLGSLELPYYETYFLVYFGPSECKPWQLGP